MNYWNGKLEFTTIFYIVKFYWPSPRFDFDFASHVVMLILNKSQVTQKSQVQSMNFEMV